MKNMGMALDRVLVFFGIACAVFVAVTASMVALGTSKKKDSCGRVDAFTTLALALVVGFSSVQLFDSFRQIVAKQAPRAAAPVRPPAQAVTRASTTPSSYHGPDGYDPDAYGF